MRYVEQVMRFYLIGKRVGYRSIKSLMDSPGWNPLLTLSVRTIKEYPESAISRCRIIRREIDRKVFRFDWKQYDYYESGEEELPRGTILDPMELKELTREIEKYIEEYVVEQKKKK